MRVAIVNDLKLAQLALRRLVESADGSDDVIDALEDLADVHRRRLGRGIDRMGVVARPAAEVVVGIAVFFFAYSYAGPVIDMIERFAGR